MPTGQPDPHFLPQERSDVGGGAPKGRRGSSPLPGYAGTPPAGGRNGGVAEGDGGGTPPSSATPEPSLPGGETQEEYAAAVDVVRGHAERLIRKAMEAGEFDDLPGTGQPIPGAGTVDDELWWVRSWLKRNQDHESPDSG